jgi:hypothetical protein
VLAPSEHPLAARALAAYGFEALPQGGFEIDGRRCSEPRDALVAVVRDPDRPGRPLTLCVANSGQGFAEGLSAQRLGLTPGITLIRGGELEARFQLADSAPTLRLVLDLGAERRRAVERAARIQRRGFVAHVPPDPLMAGRLQSALEHTEAALSRLEALGCPLPEQAPLLFLHTHGDALQRLFGEVRLVQRSPSSDFVHAWILPAAPFDDGGAGFATECASRSLGPAAAAWLDEALGPLVAGDGGLYLGANLDEIAAAALRAGRAPSAEELIGDARRVPPVWRPGLRALLLRTLLEGAPAGSLRELWTGERAVLADGTLELAFFQALNAAAERLSPPPAVARPAPIELGLGAGLWLGRREGRAAERLLSGRVFSEMAALGLTSVRLRVPFSQRPEVGDWYPPPVEAFGEGAYRDAELIGLLSLARAAGLAPVLQLDELSGPHGDLTGTEVLASIAEWNQWFERSEALHLHGAWLAQRADAALYSLGSDLPMATRSDPSRVRVWTPADGPLAHMPILDLELTTLRQQRWRELIQRLRAAAPIALTYCALNDFELEQLGFADRLDCLGVEFLAPLVYEGEASLENDDLFLEQRLEYLLQSCRSRAERYGVPLWISTLGYPRTGASADQTARRRGPTLPSIQRRVLSLFERVYRRALNEPLGRGQAPLQGVCLWRWPITADEREERGFLLELSDPVVRDWLGGQ